jgi:predicted nucleic acid-binding Zn ribbon protein
VLAEHCRPEFVKNGVLLITVPSGAFAQRITQERESILLGLAPLGDRAPTTLRTVLADT